MQYYIEFKAKPSEDIAPEVIISQVFSICHVEIARRDAGDVGVSFPNAKVSVGNTMRLHSSETILAEIVDACAGLSDYCKIGDCKKVPATAEWRLIKRVQQKQSAAKLRRLVKRGSITTQEAEERLLASSILTHPYLQLRSASTRQNFRLFFSQSPLEAATPSESQTNFNAYGLGGAVPWF